MKKALSLLLCFCLLLAGCGADEAAPVTPSPEGSTRPGGSLQLSNAAGESWTVLVYLCGTDLETGGGFASVNIAEMAEAEISDKVNVVIQTGGAQEWAIDAISPEELQRWQLVEGDIALVDSQPLASMGAADTLGDFLQWGVEAYPADKYMCVLWNHGGGSINGIAFDELFEMDGLDLGELAQGVAQAETQFEVIGFDACLMATLETAAVLAPYSRYMVASQEVEPGTGWDYTAILDTLAENPAQTGLELGKSICDSFYKKCADGGDASLATLSVTDLSQLPALVQSFDQMAAEMKGFTAIPEKLQPLTQAMLRAENYGGNNDNEGYTNMVDLGDMTRSAQGVLPQTGAALLESLANAVPYRVEGSSRKRSNGLSVYVPLSMTTEDLDYYAKIATSGEYLRFFEGMFDWQVPQGTVINQPTQAPDAPEASQAPQTPEAPPAVTEVQVDSLTVAQALASADYTVAISTDLTDDGYVTLRIDKGADVVQSVAYNLFYLDEESNSLLFLGSDYDLNSDDTGALYWDNFRNVWPIINDQTCSMLPLEWGEDYILYTVPITLNGSPTNLRMRYDYGTASYEILGVWDGINPTTGMSSREIRGLQKGDKVEFRFSAADLETEEAYEFSFGGFTVDGEVVVEEAELFDAEFYYQYEVTDLFGKVYTSDFAVITSKNGEITVEMES